MARPVVAIVGRPNVGKSTIFNRIIGDRLAIVEDKPGVTRDRIYGTSEWNGKTFSIVDTGGIEIDAGDEIMRSVRAQAELAIDEADTIVFMVDGKAGLTHADEEVARLLFRSGKPVVVAVNKVDNPGRIDSIYEFYSLGFGDPIAISGSHGTGISDLLDRVVEALPEPSEEEYDDDVIRVALIGRPNVGKSSLVNAILGEERVIVSDVAGTTRDAIDTPFEKDGRKFVLIDTAGMRKRGKIYETTEKYSVLRSLKAIERSDVVLVLINAEEGIIEQDKHIAGYAHEAGKASVLVVNKWDAVEKDDKTMRQFELRIRDQFQFMSYAPIVFPVGQDEATAAQAAARRRTCGRTACDAGADASLERYCRRRRRGQSAADGQRQTASHQLCDPGCGQAADDCAFRQRSRTDAFLLLALSGEQDPGGVRVRRHAAPHHCAQEV